MNQPIVGVPQMLPAQVIDTSTDSREILRHAKIAARRRKLQDWFVVDVDAHHVETVSWNEAKAGAPRMSSAIALAGSPKTNRSVVTCSNRMSRAR